MTKKEYNEWRKTTARSIEENEEENRTFALSLEQHDKHASALLNMIADLELELCEWLRESSKATSYDNQSTTNTNN